MTRTFLREDCGVKGNESKKKTQGTKRSRKFYDVIGGSLCDPNFISFVLGLILFHWDVLVHATRVVVEMWSGFFAGTR
jgi:hypothetical protein